MEQEEIKATIHQCILSLEELLGKTKAGSPDRAALLLAWHHAIDVHSLLDKGTTSVEAHANAPT